MRFNTKKDVYPEIVAKLDAAKTQIKKWKKELNTFLKYLHMLFQNQNFTCLFSLKKKDIFKAKE